MTRIVLARFCLSAAQLVESRSAEDMPCPRHPQLIPQLAIPLPLGALRIAE